MLIEAVLALLAATSAGVVAAGWTPPSALAWRGSPLRLRVASLAAPPAGVGGRTLGGASLALILTTAALTAYAAQPSAPDRLPTEVAGVVVSGDQLGLRLKAQDGATERTLRPGDDYSEGWKLGAVSASEAVLTRGAESRRIGLNPTGALMDAASEAGSAKILVLASAPPPPPMFRTYTPEEIRARRVADWGEETAAAIEALGPRMNSTDALTRLRASIEYNTLLLNNPVSPYTGNSADSMRANIAAQQVRLAWMEGGQQGPDPSAPVAPRVLQ